jgi:hypothetical protein
MSTDPTAGAAGADAAAQQPGQPGQPSEEELRAAYEAELSRITSADMMLQAAVSLLNIASFRLAPKAPAQGAVGEQAPPRVASGDLEQVSDAIDGVRALLEILERRIPSELRPLRDALSQLQIAYAREAQAAGGGEQTGVPQPAPSEPQGHAGGDSAGQQGQGEAPGGQEETGPGPAESSGRLWVPGR